VYATPTDVRDVLARDSASPTGTAAELSDAKVTEQIVSAQAQVDGRLSARYTVPFNDPAPQLVRDITRDIAAYGADLVYRQGLDYETDRDPVMLRYQQALALLAQIASGAIDLPVDPGTAESGGVMRGVNQYDGRLFGMDDFGLGVRGGWDVR